MNVMMSRIFQIIEVNTLKNRQAVVICVHLIQAALAYYFAFVLRFESILSPFYFYQLLLFLPALLLIRLILFVQAGLHKNLWRYSSINEMTKIVKTSTIGSILFFVAMRFLVGEKSFPFSIFVIDWLLIMVISGGSRFLLRIIKEDQKNQILCKKTLVVGSGDAGEAIVRDMKNYPHYGYKPIGIIDENPYKEGLLIHGIPILGSSKMLPEVIEKYKPDEILYFKSTEKQKTIKEIYEICKPFNIPIKKMPGLNEILNGTINVKAKIGQDLINSNLVTAPQVQEALKLQKQEGGKLGSKLIKLGYIKEDKLVSFLNKNYGISHIKSISLEDLLQREPIKAKIESVKNYIENKSVLVTGAGGSIGSEICRQIMNYNPGKLVLIDRYENSLHQIDLELRKNKQKTDLITSVLDIQDKLNLNYLFYKLKPQIVFHTAAYKHVPLMEHSPIEAAKNNIFGTKNLIEMASKNFTESFLMISTDKAVNPTNVMGATKRVAEFLTYTMNANSMTQFKIVRFGNVLGSNGSVVPVFRDQLKKGGPLTVTHPDIKRFFMLIPEAVQLVLIAASAGNGGEIFVLDMGEQIKIVTLAENLIRLSGFIPHEEIKIDFTGLRPGEKMYEELFDKTEKKLPTFHEKLYMAIPEIPSVEHLNRCISELELIISENAVEMVIPTIQKIVPNYRPDASIFKEEKIYSRV